MALVPEKHSADRWHCNLLKQLLAFWGGLPHSEVLKKRDENMPYLIITKALALSG
jgi:hypothetical protein